ncbi:MAG: glycosyltransferase family 2 protein [Proteobacteria bacterium]|jgi:cellulose synthase/poly-beta-1,6-N-acetylglucosamine synthase-like glycosyltransferase|nr:glycosyltransferase family 2 protein [Pseudomonadota bacterium]
MLENTLIVCYLSILGLLAIYGFHRSMLVYLFFKTKDHIPKPKRIYGEEELPFITVQLPLFNERYVCGRLIDAVVEFDYPRNLFEIQVLDDSTDDTTEIARAKTEEVAARGFQISLIHRTDRTGYKAGALENGLRTAKGELVAVFDADFVPPTNILRDTVHFFSDEGVGMVQARWDHLNRQYSMLTRIQSLMLDGHFVIEHGARQRSGRFFNFNGTAGIWRIKAIADAGGWEHDTLTEDMDLSYRAQLKGWRFIYLPDITAPAEIPVEMASFKSQQHRWAKGSIQVCRKMLPTILKSDVPFKVKLEAFFHLTNNFAYLLMIFLALLLLPNLLVRTHHGWREVLLIDLPLFFGTTVSIGTFYVVAHKQLYGGTWKAIAKLPLLMSLGIGLSINNAKAVLEGIFGLETPFVRTAKHGMKNERTGWAKTSYRAKKGLVPLLELLFAAYFVATIAVAIRGGHWVSIPFLVLFLLGYLYVGMFSIYQRH